jgi:IclR family transcriptional regulator, pca regulon regulatory protein
MIFVQLLNEMTGARKQTDFLGGFAKGLSVIEAFTAEAPRLSIAEVAAATGHDRATARRCLLTLADLGYADYDGKFFRLTPRVLRLGTACLATMPLPSIVQPMLDELSRDIGQSTSVSILDDWEIVYVARAAQQRIMSINLTPGSRIPACCASMGRVLLAGLTEDEVRKLLKRHPAEKRTPKTVTDPDRIVRILNKTRKDGYAINDQELELGIRSIAVPLYDSKNRLVAAINVGVAAVHDDASQLRTLYLDKLVAVQQALKPLLT